MPNEVNRELFKAIHEGKWLDVHYRNKSEEKTHFWLEVLSLDVKKMRICGNGFHLGDHELKEMTVYVDRILSASVISGTWSARNELLISDIAENPTKYAQMFGNAVNLRILDYFADCAKLDSDPYCSEYALLRGLDNDSFQERRCVLTKDQFSSLVGDLLKENTAHHDKRRKTNRLREIAMNVLSIEGKRGLYVLAYRRLTLDVSAKALVAEERATVCRQFVVDRSVRQSMRIDRYLDGDDQRLLVDFDQNIEKIKDCLSAYANASVKVNDMPYVMLVATDYSPDLAREYSGVIQMYEADKVTVPVKAFFGELVKPHQRRKTFPLALLGSSLSLDQLSAVDNAISQPLTYVQGPPGTGKTLTIINTIVSAFFNKKTVLMSSYNNLPVDNVCSELLGLKYEEQPVLFPVFRLGNPEVTTESLDLTKRNIEAARAYRERYGSVRASASAAVTSLTAPLLDLLRRHQELIDLEERRDAIVQLLESVNDLRLHIDLQALQLNMIEERIAALGHIDDEDAQALLDSDPAPLLERLFFAALASYQRLEEPRYTGFRELLAMTNKKERVKEFNKWMSDGANLRMLLRVFPVVGCTCLSARRLGDPEPVFDLTIIDEASQCNTAATLIPIIRGKNLMLVGDPQQLSPITQLDPHDNAILRKRYSIPKEYDYLDNSVYKVYLTCDSVSNEILLKNHYRCDEAIIGFSNRKYYNNRLRIKTDGKSEEPLLFIDVERSETTGKNSAPREADAVIKYAFLNPDKNIGVITPFRNQRQLIEECVRENDLFNVTCGTVHAFQGDEKDVVLLSLGLTRQTRDTTYEWLCNNRELINVATTRARDKLVLVASGEAVERLHGNKSPDDLYELVQYVKTNGHKQVTSRAPQSRALGIKPYSTATEEAFFKSVNHAISTINSSGRKHSVKREVPISQVFIDNPSYSDLFYSGRFDFVIYERLPGSREMPILAVELDGREHFEEEVVRRRDEKKNVICHEHGFELIRVDNTYARRYVYIKDLLIQWLDGR